VRSQEFLLPGTSDGRFPGRAIVQERPARAAASSLYYRHRNLIERCCSHLEEPRAIATHYDKTATSYAAGIAIVVTLD
jgi:transposase